MLPGWRFGVGPTLIVLWGLTAPRCVRPRPCPSSRKSTALIAAVSGVLQSDHSPIVEWSLLTVGSVRSSSVVDSRLVAVSALTA